MESRKIQALGKRMKLENVLLPRPTDLFTVLEPQNLEKDELYVVRKHQSTDCEAVKVWKGQSGPLSTPAELSEIKTCHPS